MSEAAPPGSSVDVDSVSLIIISPLLGFCPWISHIILSRKEDAMYVDRL